MIKFAKDMPVTQRENVMGGTGRYSSQMLFSPEEVTKTRLFACNTMEPGASIGCHSHTGEGEAYLILSGEAVVEEDGVATASIAPTAIPTRFITVPTRP